jgi:hypothetical protein
MREQLSARQVSGSMQYEKVSCTVMHSPLQAAAQAGQGVAVEHCRQRGVCIAAVVAARQHVGSRSAQPLRQAAGCPAAAPHPSHAVPSASSSLRSAELELGPLVRPMRGSCGPRGNRKHRKGWP